MRPEEEEKEESVEETSDDEFSYASEEATIDGLVTSESANFKEDNTARLNTNHIHEG